MQRFAIVMRTILVAIVILTVTGLFPAMASLGSCAMKPCCAQERAIAIAGHPACCSETTGSMTPARPVAFMRRPGVRERPIVAAFVKELPIPTTAPDHVRQNFASRSPAPARETFSILLI